MHQRRHVPPSTITGDAAEHEARQCCYRAHNLTVGPSWEARDWFQSQFLEWDPAAEVELDERRAPSLSASLSLSQNSGVLATTSVH